MERLAPAPHVDNTATNAQTPAGYAGLSNMQNATNKLITM